VEQVESESAAINYSHPDESVTSCCISPVKDIAVFIEKLRTFVKKPTKYGPSLHYVLAILTDSY
jgi:hypothetical protein